MENKPKKRSAASRKPKQLPLSIDALRELLAAQLVAATTITPQLALKQLKAEGQVSSVEDITTALDGLVSAGQAFRHPGTSGGKGVGYAYGLERPEAFVAKQLQHFIGRATELTLKSLRSAVPKAYLALADEAIGDLLREKKLFEVPGGGKTKKYSSVPPLPSSVLTAAQRKSLETILTNINALRSSALSLVDLLGYLDGATQSPRQPTASTPHLPLAVLTLTQLIEFYKLDLPSRHGLSSMPVPMTWRRYLKAAEAAGHGPDREAFESVLMDSAASGAIELSSHECPARLAREEVAEAISRPDGQVLYYWRPIR